MFINNSTSAPYYRWKPACWLRVSGDDAANFLQGQFTNDLRLLETRPAVYGLWLSVKGKVLADSFVLKRDGAFWIGSYFSSAAVIQERLESYVIADDVVIENQTEEWEATAVTNETSEAAPIEADVFVFPGRRSETASIEIVRRVARDASTAFAFKGPELSHEEMQRMRVKAGIPAVPADVGPGDLPNEAGLEGDAISYTKGCYLGQEVMARLKSMGQLRRRLWRVRGSGSLPGTLPVPVFAGARQVGELRSAVRENGSGWVGLAMVSLLHVSAGGSLSFTANGRAEILLADTP
jgi:folate-binding protein YgfZ